MTAVLMSANGPTEVINARRTESLDAANIIKLVSPSTEQLFGRVNIVHLIEKSVLAVTLNNEREEVLAHAAFFDYPNFSDVDQSKWQEWLNAQYDTETCTPLNTLFMHYFVSKGDFSHGSAREIIRTVFNAVPDIHFIFLVVPGGVYPDLALAELFVPMDKKAGAKPSEKCVVFVCHRHTLCPVLYTRKARVEDHDDLTPIFNRQSDMLRKSYGDYFLAELIEAQDENHHALIVEMEGTAVGFMSVASEVNVELLNSCFELVPFHGLCKPHPEDVLRPPTPPAEEVPVVENAPGSRAGSEAESHSRTSSLASIKKGEEFTTARPSSGVKTISQQATPQAKSVSRGSGATADLTVQRKLSDAHMEGTPVASDVDDVGSVHSEASSKRSSLARSVTEPTKPFASKEGSIILDNMEPAVKFEPVFAGESNAFCIQLFCIDERYEMRSMDFLPLAFSLFPDKDFCVVTVPHLVPEFPLLQSFVRVTPKCPSTLPQELYVFNRAGILQSFNVRPVCPEDRDDVAKLVDTIDNKESILADFDQFNRARRDDDGTPIQAFVGECGGQIVSVAITRSEEDIEYIRSHYNIEDFIYYNHHRRDEHAHLYHFTINPIFQHYTKHMLKEVLRQSHRSCLYYPVFPPYSTTKDSACHSIVTCLNHMVPVRARRQIIYPLDRLGGNASSKRVIKEKEKFALNHINRKLTLEPKVTINSRIVIVGASDVSLSFLETLAFCPHLRFNNLVLISPHGLPGDLATDDIVSNFLSTPRNYTRDELAQISLRTWVNVVNAKMIAIDRASKYVKVTGGAKVPYDHLVIATGQQYQVTMPTGADITKLATNTEIQNSPNRRFSGRVPRNVLLVNDEHDAMTTVNWLQKNFLTTEGNAIVYGSSLDAYTTVQSLLKVGVAGSRIHLVHPPPNYNPSCFNNSAIETAVNAALADEDVQVHDGYYLAQWNDGKSAEEVYCVSFTSDTKPLKLECSVFFCFYRKAVDYEAFKAINDSCLVFDGRLVIDANFHTNDLSIRAAGPVTKFQRKYHADQWTHSNFNSREVGQMLASTMLRLFDPTIENDPAPPEETMNLIPMYHNSKVQAGILPGGLNYLNFTKPNLNEPLEKLMAQQDYGRELITGTVDGPGYFRIHLNKYNSIETITCLSKKVIDTSNLLCLYNIHERFLNNMVSRFDEGLISDFYSFFRETWSLAIFHDRFPDFRQEVRELLVQRPSHDVIALEEKVRQLIDQDLELDKQDRKYLTNEFDEAGNKRAVETRLLSFLSYNYYHLPVYAKPGMV
ncbi:cilia- and flagella-associated protein 61-like [Anneissia japonica]|uniref:cilia- and flagella-associated protein 61-like n=1 Tax=Anneissia japonica TaxID=1529436 RepID=UPI001425B77B|nr:cilia- and flagella-associated protein 61-like [Anneissia japonica]